MDTKEQKTTLANDIAELNDKYVDFEVIDKNRLPYIKAKDGWHILREYPETKHQYLRYLVGRDKEFVKDLTQELLDAAHERESKYIRENGDLRVELNQVSCENMRLKEQLKEKHELIIRLRKSEVGHSDRAHRMEHDISMIRKAIGDIRMQEILRGEK